MFMRSPNENVPGKSLNGERDIFAPRSLEVCSPVALAMSMLFRSLVCHRDTQRFCHTYGAKDVQRLDAPQSVAEFAQFRTVQSNQRLRGGSGQKQTVMISVI